MLLVKQDCRDSKFNHVGEVAGLAQAIFAGGGTLGPKVIFHLERLHLLEFGLRSLTCEPV